MPPRFHTLHPATSHEKIHAGIPYIRWYGIENFAQGSYNVLVMDLLGFSLEDFFSRCGRHFSLKTVLMIADQTLLRIEYIHSKCKCLSLEFYGTGIFLLSPTRGDAADISCL